MKTKMLILAAALGSGFALLQAQDAPKPPPAPGGEGRQGGPGGPPGGGGGDPQARIDEAFKKMDTNGDGKISKEEFLEFSKKEAEDRFSKIDASGSGSVTKEQIVEAMRRARGGESGGQRRPEGFRRPEGDGGGTRPRPGGEGGAPGGNPPPPPGEGSNAGGPGAPGGQGGPGGPGMMRGGMGGGQSAMGELFRKVYEGGAISKEEFSKMSEEQFKRMDSNGDGKITKEDLEELRKKAGEMRGGPGGAPGGAPQGEGGFRRRPAGDGAAPKGDVPRRPEAN